MSHLYDDPAGDAWQRRLAEKDATIARLERELAEVRDKLEMQCEDCEVTTGVIADYAGDDSPTPGWFMCGHCHNRNMRTAIDRAASAEHDRDQLRRELSAAHDALGVAMEREKELRGVLEQMGGELDIAASVIGEAIGVLLDPTPSSESLAETAEDLATLEDRITHARPALSTKEQPKPGSWVACSDCARKTFTRDGTDFVCGFGCVTSAEDKP